MYMKFPCKQIGMGIEQNKCNSEVRHWDKPNSQIHSLLGLLQSELSPWCSSLVCLMHVSVHWSGIGWLNILLCMPFICHLEQNVRTSPKEVLKFLLTKSSSTGTICQYVCGEVHTHGLGNIQSFHPYPLLLITVNHKSVCESILHRNIVCTVLWLLEAYRRILLMTFMIRKTLQ